MNEKGQYLKAGGPGIKILCILMIVIDFIACAAFSLLCMLKIDMMYSAIFSDSFFNSFLYNFYVYHSKTVMITSVCVVAAMSGITFILRKKKGFPSKLSVITMFYNFVVIAAFALFFFLLDYLNIFYSYQSVFIIPLITSVLSIVFLIADTVDYFLGRLPVSKPKEPKEKKAKKEKSVKAEKNVKLKGLKSSGNESYTEDEKVINTENKDNINENL